jgi:hypothetical protein
MNHLFKILVLFFAITSPAGCGNSRQEPDLKGIKIGELAPTGQRIRPQFLTGTNINAIAFELPAENVKSLDGIWKILNTDTVRYTDPNGFASNGLRAAAGDFVALNKVNGLLKSAEAKKLSTTALLIQNGQSEVINTGRLNSKTTISYIYRKNSIKSAVVGPGILGLQVTARQIPGAQMMANVQAVPVISVSTEGLAPELGARLKESELRFYSAAFSMIMRPGDFIVVAPAGYKTDVATAAGRFFTKPEPNQTITVLLMVCTSIS